MGRDIVDRRLCYAHPTADSARHEPARGAARWRCPPVCLSVSPCRERGAGGTAAGPAPRPNHRREVRNRTAHALGSAAELNVRFCPQCGTPVTPGARFCVECGAQLAAAEPSESTGTEGAALQRRALPSPLWRRLPARRPIPRLARQHRSVRRGLCRDSRRRHDRRCPHHAPTARSQPLARLGRARRRTHGHRSNFSDTSHPQVKFPKEALDFIANLEQKANANPSDLAAWDKLGDVYMRAALLDPSYYPKARDAYQPRP